MNSSLSNPWFDETAVCMEEAAMNNLPWNLFFDGAFKIHMEKGHISGAPCFICTSHGHLSSKLKEKDILVCGGHIYLSAYFGFRFCIDRIKIL